MSDAAAELAKVVLDQWARILSALVRYTGSVELAEDSLQEALARALVARDRQIIVTLEHADRTRGDPALICEGSVSPLSASVAGADSD